MRQLQSIVLCGLVLLTIGCVQPPITPTPVVSTPNITEFTETTTPLPTDDGMFDHLVSAIYLYDIDSRALTRISPSGDSAYCPAFSADGRYLSFAQDGFVLYDRQSQEITRTNIVGEFCGYEWSPDAKTIAFLSARLADPALLLHDVESAKTRRVALTLPPKWGTLQWSPDSQSIALVISNIPVVSPEYTGTPMPDPQASALITVDVTSDTVTTLFETNGATGAPAWSPDGTRIAFTVDPCVFCPIATNTPTLPDNREQVYITNRDGNIPTVLVETRLRAGRPKWSPDGDTLGFTETEDARLVSSVHLVNLTSGIHRFTKRMMFAFDFVWSPDGKWIVTSGGGGPRMFHSDTLEFSASFSSAASIYPAGWSPDGQKLLLNTSCCGLHSIMYFNPDDPMRAYGVSDEAHERMIITKENPVWAPDADLIAFSGYEGCRCP
jgi:Tol biopolymer transport system component